LLAPEETALLISSVIFLIPEFSSLPPVSISLNYRRILCIALLIF
jgi:hypothetical protein